MTFRPLPRVLDTISDETRALAAMARRLDALIPDLIARLPNSGGLDLKDLQRIDALGQYLDDISRALNHLACAAPVEIQCDLSSLTGVLVLDDFKRRILDHPEESAPRQSDGHLHLF